MLTVSLRLGGGTFVYVSLSNTDRTVDLALLVALDCVIVISCLDHSPVNIFEVEFDIRFEWLNRRIEGPLTG